MSINAENVVSHVVADPLCDLHQEWPTKPDSAARCTKCRTMPSAEVDAIERVLELLRDAGVGQIVRTDDHGGWDVQDVPPEVVAEVARVFRPRLRTSVFPPGIKGNDR